jgi:hypothetical protein
MKNYRLPIQPIDKRLRLRLRLRDFSQPKPESQPNLINQLTKLVGQTFKFAINLCNSYALPYVSLINQSPVNHLPFNQIQSFNQIQPLNQSPINQIQKEVLNDNCPS